jgi:Fe-S-cluster-containing hydrogenase component 2
MQGLRLVQGGLSPVRKQEGFTDFSFAFIRETINCSGCAMCASVCPDIAICVYARTKIITLWNAVGLFRLLRKNQRRIGPMIKIIGKLNAHQ